MPRKSTRRSFMQTSTAIGAGIWAGHSLTPVFAQSRNKSEKINFASIGVEGKGSSDSRDASNHGNMVAICDIDEKRLEKAAARYPDAKKFVDYREMLAEMGDKIDAVTVSTPDHSHAPASLLAISMGKNCFTQKPLTWSIHEARLMRDMANEKGVATQMGNQGTSNNGLREAVEMCLQRDPMERPSMETLKSFFSSTGASELETTNHEAGTVIVQPGRLASVAATTKSSEPLPTNDRKKKWLAPVVAVAAAAALVVGVLAIQQPSNSETATTQENPSSLNENNVDLSTDQLSFEVETTTTATAPSEETTTSAPLETTTTNAAETTTSTTSLPIESERLEENVLTANYTWGPSEETLSLQEVLGLEADGYYGEGTRDAHVAELAARGLSAMNVPDMPTVSNGLAPENLPEETTTTTTAPEYGPLIVVESVSPTDVSTGGTVSVVWTATRTGGVEESSVFSQASNAGDGYQTLFMNGSTSSLVPIQNGYRITSIFSIVASTNCGSWNVHLGADDYAGFPNTGVRNGAFNVSNCGAVSTTTTTAPSPPSTTTTTTPCESRHEVPNLVGLLTWQVAEIPWPSEPSCSPFIMREYQVQASGETIGGFFECDSVEPPIISQSLAAGTLYTIAELGSLGLDVYRQSCPT